jgi:hypothetical protein
LALAVFVGVALAVGSASPTLAEAGAFPLENCAKGAFSTEEDFTMQNSEPYDGDPVISDGDLLSRNGQLCARNRDLLAAFAGDKRIPDLGLDAVDILDIPDRILALSTEIDDPGGSFTAGDLLLTTGAVIPNRALMHLLDPNAPQMADVGLDAVQFIGTRDNKIQFVNAIGAISRDGLIKDPGQLKELLERHKVDIWFSIEGTLGTAAAPTILDGDLLSASGTIVVKQQALLPPSTPAGIPVRGVDFGLDAIQTEPTANVEIALSRLTFSTEILYWGEPAFADGDVVKLGNGVVTPNAALVDPFKPAADFLGLDALSLGRGEEGEPEPMITMIGSRSVWDIEGGVVDPTGTGSGLYTASAGVDPRRPFGWFVPIDGYLPDTVTEFRVAFRPNGQPRPAPDSAPGINTTWKIQNTTGFSCQYNATYVDNGNGWFTFADYSHHRFVEPCIDGGVVLAVWDTLNDPNIADRSGHYILWLEWKTTGGGATVFQEPVDHHVQLDNQKPVISKLELRTPDGTVVLPCGNQPNVEKLEVYAEFNDNFFGGYRLRVRGGNPPKSVYYPSSTDWHNYWDGTPETASLDANGTTPGGLQLLREIDMKDLGASYVECCYDLDLWINDRAIRHTFNQIYAWPDQPGWAWPSKFLTFAAAP